MGTDEGLYQILAKKIEEMKQFLETLLNTL